MQGTNPAAVVVAELLSVVAVVVAVAAAVVSEWSAVVSADLLSSSVSIA